MFHENMGTDASRRSNSIDDELGLGVALTTSEIVRLSSSLSSVYLQLIDVISEKLTIETKLPPAALRIICRRAVVPIAHCFFEKLARVRKAISSKSNQLVVQKGSAFVVPQTIEEIDGQWIYALAFNLSVVSSLSEIWDVQKIPATKADELSVPLQAKFQNNLFRIRKNNFSAEKFYRLLNKLMARVPPCGRFPVLTFANAEGALYLRGFYLKDFKRVNDRWSWEILNADHSFRKFFFTEDLVGVPGVRETLEEIGLHRNQASIAIKQFCKFIGKIYPIQMLEGLQNNFAAAEKTLAPFNAPALFSSGEGDTRSTFVVAAAKSKGFKIVKAQHGGHYGYNKDFSPALEIEWPAADEFLTWGWTRKPAHSASGSLNLRPLPSPWLSERKKYWKSLRIGGKKPFDILWMPQMMKRFTGAPQGASTIRRDVIQEFSDYMIDLISSASTLKVRIYCKPYNPLTVRLLAKTFERMKLLGGKYYECADVFDKGLSYELVEKANLVLWDQPGTGFLECVSCGIPTMIFWSRLFCEEEEWCVSDFRRLEDVGIIHRTSESLLNEHCKFAKSPAAWMNDKQRRTIVDDFVKKYALVDEQWWKSWRAYLVNIKAEVARGCVENV